MNPYIMPYGTPSPLVKPQHYFAGEAIDPMYVIKQFKKLLKHIPPTVEKTVPLAVTKGSGKKSGTFDVREIKQIMLEAGYSEDHYIEFQKWMNAHKKRIRMPKDKSQYADVIMKKYEDFRDSQEIEKRKKESEEALMKVKQERKTAEESKDETKLKEAVEKENEMKSLLSDVIEEDRKLKEEEKKDILEQNDAENEAISVGNIIKEKSSRLADILKKQFNFKANTKLPTGLDKEFMSAFPDEEEEVITKYSSALEAIKVKNDDADASGIKSKELDDMKLQSKLAALANKRIRLKKRIKQIARDPQQAPPMASKTLAKNPRGKVKIKGPGRGKKTNNIDPSIEVPSTEKWDKIQVIY